MRIGLASYKFKNNDIKFNISQIEKAIISAKNIDMLCFGEAFIQGFDCLTWEYSKDIKIALNKDSDIINKIKDLSKKYNIDLAFGYIEEDNKNIYSSYMIIIDGLLAYNYKRISEGWKDTSLTDYHYKEGEDIVKFKYKDNDFTVALCGDIWAYPKKFKTSGILIWPVYVDVSLEEWKTYEEEYAKQAFLSSSKTLMINSICLRPICHGNAFYFKDGKVEESLGYDKEDVLVIDL